MNCWHCNTELIWGGDQSIGEDCLPHLQEQVFILHPLLTILAVEVINAKIR